MSNICVLHIGKTGGSYLKSFFRHSSPNLLTNDFQVNSNTIHLLNHNHTLSSTKEKFGINRKLIFCFRDPIERFHSAFYSRMRQGRPTYSFNWNAAEAISFLYFKNSNLLAESLTCNDSRLQSAAHFAMNNIQHLSKNYKYYLGSIKDLESEKSNIISCIKTSNLKTQTLNLSKLLNLSNPVSPSQMIENKNQSFESYYLSERGRLNLLNYWKEEFDIYNYLLTKENS